MIPIGMDIGHSAVKLAYSVGGKVRHTMFPSAVIPGFDISDEMERKRAQNDTVFVHNNETGESTRYFVGETALAQGSSSVTGLNSKWIHTAQHAALIIAANQLLDREGVGNREDRLIVLGLPVEGFATQKTQLISICRGLLADSQSKVMMQPVGALQTVFIDRDGNEVAGRQFDKESWAAIDIGHYTTDIVSFENGRFQDHIKGGCRGMHMACEALINILRDTKYSDIDLIEAERCLLTNRIQYFNVEEDITEYCDRAKAVLTTEVMELASRLLEQGARRRHGVLLCGGGSSVVYDELKRRWPNTHLAADGRFAVAEGMRRLAALSANQG